MSLDEDFGEDFLKGADCPVVWLIQHFCSYRYEQRSPKPRRSFGHCDSMLRYLDHLISL
jgi:hypothetical protein